MLNFTLNTLYTAKLEDNIIPYDAIKEVANYLDHYDSIAESIMNHGWTWDDSSSTWNHWKAETTKDGRKYSGTWTKRFAKLCHDNGHEIKEPVLAKIGEIVSRYTSKGEKEYFFEIAKYADWRPGDFKERDGGSCWWTDKNDSRLGLMQDPRGYSVLLYETEEHFKRYSKQKGIGRCWMIKDTNYAAIFNAYGVPLSTISQVIAKRFEVPVARMNVFSDGAYINKGNKDNEGHAGGQAGIGYVFSKEKLGDPLDMGCFQLMKPCPHCQKLGRNFNRIKTRSGNREVCRSCIEHIVACDACGYHDHEDNCQQMFLPHKKRNGKVCSHCVRLQPAANCEVHGKVWGKSLKVWHKKEHYCEYCITYSEFVCRCGECGHVVNEYKAFKLKVANMKLCKPCTKKVKEML